jgi:hypothetical protein
LNIRVFPLSPQLFICPSPHVTINLLRFIGPGVRVSLHTAYRITTIHNKNWKSLSHVRIVDPDPVSSGTFRQDPDPGIIIQDKDLIPDAILMTK